MQRKSTVDEIRARFDADVERFSNLETGQTAAINAPLVLELITSAAAAASPRARRVLDVGCGAGNYSLKLLERLPNLDVTLIDLSLPMLERARQRVSGATAGEVTTIQCDIREIELPPGHYDIILAAAVLHHLRTEEQWRAVFARLYETLRPGGGLWIADLVEHSLPCVQSLMWNRYGDYLESVGGAEYREKVYAYVEQEDTPKALVSQLELLRQVGFANVELLHKNSVFAAFGATK
jgi:tRNA (cmo5U34)-methyltransferase